MARKGRDRRALAGATLALLALSLPSAALARQETGAPADTLPARSDTAGADTLGADTVGVDTSRARRRPRGYYPEHLSPANGRGPSRAWECDRKCLLMASSTTLADLLEDRVPSLTLLRAGYYGGPHHLLDGPFGPGFVEVRSGDLRLPPLEAGQTDLSRIPLAWLDGVTVTRRAGSTEVRLEPMRHDTSHAYSRITVGTGQPDLNAIRAVYANGMGRNFSVSTGIDLLNSGGDRAGSDDLDFWSHVSWVPGGGRAGLELLWKNQSMTRVVGAGNPVEFDRRDVYLRGRGDLADGVQVSVAAGQSQWLRAGDEAAGAAAEGEEEAGPRVEAEGASFSLTARGDPGYAGARLEAWRGSARPSGRGRAEAGLQLPGRIWVGGGVRASQWQDFSALSYRGGIRVRPGLGVGLELSGRAARGTRGVSRPWTGGADSLSFETARGWASLELGPYRLGGGGGIQRVERQLPFSALFDRGVAPGPASEMLVGEGQVEGPVVPVGWVLDGTEPIRFLGSWRHHEPREGRLALYVPTNLARAGLAFHDRFFEGDLEVRAELGLRYRGSMRTVEFPAGTPTVAPPVTTTDWRLTIRLLDAYIWWRRDNLSLRLVEDVGGLIHPRFRNFFGVKWEFFN